MLTWEQMLKSWEQMLTIPRLSEEAVMPQLRRTWGGRQRSDARGATHPPPTYLSRALPVHIMLLFIKPHFNAFSIWLPIATYGNAPFRVRADAVNQRGNGG